MKKSRYNEEQIVCILREVDRDPVCGVAKRHGVSEPSIYAWRGMSTDDVKHLKALEIENTRHKKLVVERDLEIQVMREIAEKKC